MQNSPLQLNSLFVGDFELKPAPTPGPFQTKVNVTTEINYGRNEDNMKQWLVELVVRFKSPDEQPIQYVGAVKIEGIFTVLPVMEEPQHLRLVAVTCPTILYGTAREVIANLTARGKHGVFLLPSVSFADQQIKESPDKEKRVTVTPEPARQ
ncbi:MAG: protein-export chaperone SecB [Opitutae bacterium]|nr:protein-export chaperone SecB [Opitutae bacterium]